jgi:hypothetical protein
MSRKERKISKFWHVALRTHVRDLVRQPLVYPHVRYQKADYDSTDTSYSLPLVPRDKSVLLK